MTQLVHVDAFTTTPFRGNPAGVVLDADRLSARQMVATSVAFAVEARRARRLTISDSRRRRSGVPSLALFSEPI